MQRQRTWGTSTDALCVVSALEETVDTTDGELEAGFRGAGLTLASFARGLARLGTRLALARHC